MPPLAPRRPAQDPAFQAVTGKVRGAAASARAHEPPAQKAAQAAAAAEMPAAERQGIAQGQLAAETASAAGAQQGRAAAGSVPGFDKAGFVAAVRAKIDQLTPKDPKAMENISGSGVFEGAKAAVDGQVTAGKAAAQGNVDDKLAEAPRTEAVPERPAAPLAPNEPGAPPPAVEAAGAAPKPRGPGEVEAPLAAASAQLDAQMAGAGVTEEQLKRSNEPAFTGALEARTEAAASVQSAPQQYRAREQGALTAAQTQAGATAQAGIEGMSAGRAAAFSQLDTVQAGGTRRDEAKRAELGQKVSTIYESARGEVEGILDGMDRGVDQAFQSGAESAKSSAIAYINRETTVYKDKRYKRDAGLLDVGAHLSGALTHLGDAIGEMPPEYFAIFRAGRDRYVAEMDKVLGRVADIVADHLTRARQRIEQGRAQIAELIASQPASLRELANEVAGDALTKFSQLEQTVDSRQEQVVDNLAQKYVEQAQALDSELDQMREAEKGLLARAGDAIGGVIKTIEELGSLLAGALARAAGAIPLILRDPIQFLGNLIEGVGQGLRNFAGNIGTHLQSGLISWLTGAVGAAGISLPARLDLPGILDLVLQILGLTWAQIRSKIARALGPQGEQVMGALEQAFEVFQIIRTQGLAGLWQFIGDKVGDLQEMVIGQIKTMVSDQVIKAGIDWLVGLLGGPAGAFVKAAQGIVRIVTWFVQNGSRVAALVNSVVDSVTAIAGGNISGAAKFIEQSLAQALPTVIGFLANLLGLGGISQKVQEIIKKVQAPVEKGIQWVVQKALAVGKKLLGKLGLGGKAGTGKSSQADNAAARGRAREMVAERIKQPFETRTDLAAAVSSIETELKPQGLRALILSAQKGSGGYSIVAREVKEGEKVGVGDVKEDEKDAGGSAATVPSASTDPLATAKAGGKHGGLYVQYEKKDTKQLMKALQSYEAQVAEHIDKINNPVKHIPDWNSLDPRQREALINKKWPSDRDRNKELADIMRGILRERGVSV